MYASVFFLTFIFRLFVDAINFDYLCLLTNFLELSNKSLASFPVLYLPQIGYNLRQAKALTPFLSLSTIKTILTSCTSYQERHLVASATLVTYFLTFWGQ